MKLLPVLILIITLIFGCDSMRGIDRPKQVDPQEQIADQPVLNFVQN